MHLVASPLSRYFTCVHQLRSKSNLNTSNREKTRSRLEAESKEKHGVWDPNPITSPYVHSRVDSNTFTIGNPMPDSTLTLCQSRVDFIPQSGLKTPHSAEVVSGRASIPLRSSLVLNFFYTHTSLPRIARHLVTRGMFWACRRSVSGSKSISCQRQRIKK